MVPCSSKATNQNPLPQIVPTLFVPIEALTRPRQTQAVLVKGFVLFMSSHRGVAKYMHNILWNAPFTSLRPELVRFICMRTCSSRIHDPYRKSQAWPLGFNLQISPLVYARNVRLAAENNFIEHVVWRQQGFESACFQTSALELLPSSCPSHLPRNDMCTFCFLSPIPVIPCVKSCRPCTLPCRP